ncbi:MAG: hypothetical protein O6761_07840 [Thaumarchaeota archaeon]|nr:hypothetical protein [Nitrososphaerota archaeon]
MSDDNIVLSKKDFEFMDKADSNQIISADDDLKKALVYDVRGKKAITLIGLKFLILKMSQAGQPITICESVTTLDKDHLEDESKWFWRSTIKVKNEKSGLETEGVSESPYLDESNYDKFGRIKSASKAERNAWRKQVPELEILDLLKNTDVDRTQTLQTDEKPQFQSGYCTCFPDQRQVTPDKTGCSNCHKNLSPLVSEELRKRE